MAKPASINKKSQLDIPICVGVTSEEISREYISMKSRGGSRYKYIFSNCFINNFSKKDFMKENLPYLNQPKFETKWLTFRKMYLPKKKTETWEITSKGHDTLGFIKWYAPWRCYSFFPCSSTIFNSTCIKDILDFINKLMEARKK